jgi:hypothetical protein
MDEVLSVVGCFNKTGIQESEDRSQNKGGKLLFSF